MASNKRSKSNEFAGSLFVACIILGSASGFLVGGDNFWVGSMIGVGVGFIISSAVRFYGKD